MNIGVFSTCEHPGGSEFRCAELANGIARHTPHHAFLLCEGMIHAKVLRTVDRRVSIRLNVMRIQEKAPVLYDMDVLIVVNTNSTEFTDAGYWQGETDRHGCAVDLSRVKRFVFLFNFVIEPAARLPSLLGYVGDVRLITANTLFFHSLSTLDRFRDIRHLPRLVLASPIDPGAISTHKKPSIRIRIGQHSMPYVPKFNPEIASLISRINDKHVERVSWHFMGLQGAVANVVARQPNVVLRKPFSVTVRDFLEETDIFLFYPAWDRVEPWARSIAEALMSGCPVVATTRGGSRDQIIPGNNGYLCRCLDDFTRHLSVMIEQPDLIRTLGRNASLYSRFFCTEHVIRELMEFIR